MSEKIKNLLKDIYRNMQAIFGDALIDVFLFGSYARGDYDEESDIDIAVIIKGDRKGLEKYHKSLTDEMINQSLKNDVLVSFVDIPQDDFEEYKEVLPFYKNICREGVRLSA